MGEERCIKPDRVSAKLKPDTPYTVKVGTLSVDDPLPDDMNVEDDDLAAKLPDASVWQNDLLNLQEDRSTAYLRTYPEAKPGGVDKLAFVIGSCRYPGILWKTKTADRIFGPLLDEARGKGPTKASPANLVLMVGDQIYADKYKAILRADTFEEFQERYQTAFGSLNMRKLLRHIPNYMILDDHEIDDNWTQDRMRKNSSRSLFNFAMGAYMSYQWSHSPRNFESHLYYHFECGGYPFFVLDTRTQRFVDDEEEELSDNHILGRPALPDEEESQLDRLLGWLKMWQDKNADAPKFVVTSSVFVPNPMRAREGLPEGRSKIRKQQASDSWPGFPTTRRALLHFILEEGIQNVVFLSGDIHCSNVAQMSFSGPAKPGDTRAFSITSSAFYWPFPFADGDPSNFVHDSTAKDQADTFDIGDGRKMDYRAWNFTQKDNYCRIDIDRRQHKIIVRVFDDRGRIVQTGRDQHDAVAELELAEW